MEGMIQAGLHQQLQMRILIILLFVNTIRLQAKMENYVSLISMAYTTLIRVAAMKHVVRTLVDHVEDLAVDHVQEGQLAVVARMCMITNLSAL